MEKRVNWKESDIRTLLGGDKIKDQKGLDVLTKEVFEIVDNFNPLDICSHMRLASLLSASPVQINFNNQDQMFKALTGYNFKEIQEEIDKKRSNEVLEGESLSTPETPETPVLVEDRNREKAYKIVNSILHPLNTIANISLINTYASSLAVIDATTQLQTNSNLQKVLKSVLVSAEVVTALAVLPTITGVVGSIRLGQKIVKTLKGRKERRAEIMHKKALEEIDTTSSILAGYKKKLDEDLKKRSGQINEMSQTFIDSEFYVDVHKSRTDKEATFDERQDDIVDGFDKVTSSRDDRLHGIITNDAKVILQEHMGIDETQAQRIFDDGDISFDSNGDVCVRGEDKPISLGEMEKRSIKNALRDRARLANMNEASKRAAFECVEVVEGKLQVKSNVDFSKLPKDVASLVERMNGSFVTEQDMDFFRNAHSCIDLIVACEQELLKQVSLDTTEKMIKSVNESKDKMTEQRGLIKSGFERMSAFGTRKKAEKLVSGRTQTKLMESISDNSMLSNRVIAIAQERLVSERPGHEEERRTPEVQRDSAEAEK